MRVALFSALPHDRAFFTEANPAYGHDLGFYDTALNEESVALAFGIRAVCAFVHDRLNADVLAMLASGGTELVALRCTGFNNVDLHAAQVHGITVMRVPAYSPHAVAEHAAALMLALNRKVHRAYNRLREGNFALEGLLGFEMAGKSVGIVGAGAIGAVTARIMAGFGCRVLAHDPAPSPAVEALGVRYVGLDVLLEEADIISLHCPLTPSTHHLIGTKALERMKPGAMLINTSRWAVVDTRAIIGALKSGRLGALGLDVYEEEGDLFFRDLSGQVLQDDVFSRLLTFPNVLITGHQGFYTREALEAIAHTTLVNISAFERGETSGNEVTTALLAD
ncbi:MAG: 2-hydroxyacid dehydrogenase [Chloroflexota bacterium]